MKKVYRGYCHSPESKKYLSDEVVRDGLSQFGLLAKWTDEEKQKGNEIDALLAFLVITSEVQVLEGKALHLFFKGEKFYDWLTKCTVPVFAEAVAILDNLCESCSYYDDLMKMPRAREVVVFHFAENQKALLFRPIYPGGLVSDGTYCSFASSKSSNEFADQAKAIICACAAYVQAFPEMVTEGIPDDLKHPNHYRNMKCRTVGIAPRLILRDGPCPHYRSGHFRFLLSDRYTEKRGQVIFVHGCFVKGKAKTVLGPDETPPT